MVLLICVYFVVSICVDITFLLIEYQYRSMHAVLEIYWRFASVNAMSAVERQIAQPGRGNDFGLEGCPLSSAKHPQEFDVSRHSNIYIRCRHMTAETDAQRLRRREPEQQILPSCHGGLMAVDADAQRLQGREPEQRSPKPRPRGFSQAVMNSISSDWWSRISSHKL